MGVTTNDKQTNQFITDTVYAYIDEAKNVIVPLSPISIFAARNPWSGLEHQQFDEVARMLWNARNVDIYPSAAIMLEAKTRGEINTEIVEDLTEQWLAQAQFTIPKNDAEQYVRKAITLESPSVSQKEQQHIETLLKKRSELNETHHMRYQQKILVSQYLRADNGQPLNKIVDYHVIKWCKLYLDDAQAGWTMPNRERGLFYAWRHLAQHDPALSKQQRDHIKQLSDNPQEVIKMTLTQLDVPQDKVQGYFENHLLALPGWAGMMLWQEQNNDKESQLIEDYLALRLGLEWVFVAPNLPVERDTNQVVPEVVQAIIKWVNWSNFSIDQWFELTEAQQRQYLAFSAQFDDHQRRKLWLEAWEMTYKQQLKAQVTPETTNEVSHSVEQSSKSTITPQAQLAFCIDVRSEPFRRQIEAAGPFETIGIAGFFGLPIEKCELDAPHTHASLPVMNEPQHRIQEYTHEKQPHLFQQRKHTLESVTYTFKKMKQNVLPSLLLPELSGPWLTLQMLSRSFVPGRTGTLIRNFYKRWLRKPQDTALTLDHQPHQHDDELPVGFTQQEQINYAQQTLKMMDLTHDFAPLVVLCGHGSHSANNPYAASLDCGACGGAASGFNAKVLAQLCNLPDVRKGLVDHGIEIPENTVFAAAEHHTSVDDLEWIYLPNLTDQAQTAFEEIQQALPDISKHANTQRLAQLPNHHITKKDPLKEANRLANDWSEIRPEWGLARNAAFIIGQRSLTEGTDLQGRVFLHNYDWEQDSDGVLLANIIGGPATVAQWINLQYYASTVAPHYYGSGSKTTQTITAGIGVMQGNASDLMTGLPWQSVMSGDDKMYHAPIRLLIVVEAPQSFVKRLLQENEAFAQKLKNGWIQLASIDENKQWHDWTANSVS